MCSSSSVLSVSLCLLLCLSSGEPVEVKVKRGEEATLPCQSPGGAELNVMKWTRPDLSQDSYVFFYRDGRAEYDRQLQSYRGRVGLKDRKMKNGDVSVVLWNVNIDDAGRYRCDVNTTGQTREVLLTVQTVHTGSQHASVVETYEGSESVQLPCYFPTFDLSNPSVVWRRSDLRPPTVHQRLSGGDNHTDQNQDYRGRTSMETDALETGDLDLFLRNPTTRDSDIYTCTIRWKEREHLQRVTLRVKGSQHASVVETYEGAESVLLPCDFTTGNLDNPSVVWSRSDLRPPTVHQRLSDRDKYTDRNEDYSGRTSMWNDALRTGDLSLTLENPTTRDRGDYNCTFRAEGRADLQRVILLVRERPGPPAGLIVGVVLGVVLAVFLVGYCIWSKTWIIRRGEQEVSTEDVKLTSVDTKASVPLDTCPNQQQENSDQTELSEDLKAGDLVQIMEDLRDGDRGRYMCRVYSKGVLQREMTLDLQVKETPQVRADGTKMMKRNNSEPCLHQSVVTDERKQLMEDGWRQEETAVAV